MLDVKSVGFGRAPVFDLPEGERTFARRPDIERLALRSGYSIDVYAPKRPLVTVAGTSR
jgi:hypothetical protein